MRSTGTGSLVLARRLLALAVLVQAGVAVWLCYAVWDLADFYFINMAQPQISTFDRMKLVSPFVVAAVWLGLAAVALCFSYRPRSTALSWAKGCAIAGFPIANGLALTVATVQALYYSDFTGALVVGLPAAAAIALSLMVAVGPLRDLHTLGSPPAE